MQAAKQQDILRTLTTQVAPRHRTRLQTARPARRLAASAGALLLLLAPGEFAPRLSTRLFDAVL